VESVGLFAVEREVPQRVPPYPFKLALERLTRVLCGDEPASFINSDRRRGPESCASSFGGRGSTMVGTAREANTGNTALPHLQLLERAIRGTDSGDRFGPCASRWRA
jgi:hypothetical protein